MILIDTSIWIDFIKAGSIARMEHLLVGESIVMHDFVYAEIAMGSTKSRPTLLAMLSSLHRIATAGHLEVMTFVENYKLFGLGLTYIDVHLLAAAHASADVEPVRLWTRDTELLKQAGRFGVAYVP